MRTVEKIVLQPTTLCNLDCAYCYLPHRRSSRKMEEDVARAIARDLTGRLGGVSLIWHGGEPLAAGKSWFGTLVEPFEALRLKGVVRHAIQTNATLIDSEWCQFFLRHQFRVGVSIDGPAALNHRRTDWRGRQTIDRTLQGIALLKDNGIRFGIIAVVGPDSFDAASMIYDFAVSLGAQSLAVNIEEREGMNRSGCPDHPAVGIFWRKLFRAWRETPVIRVREVEHALTWMRIHLDESSEECRPNDTDIFPTISTSGDVVCLSPELAGASSRLYENFVVGNVLKESLFSILRRSSESLYVRDFSEGVARCRDRCSYYSFCRGGNASNKFFEHGTTNATETTACRNSSQRLLDAILEEL